MTHAELCKCGYKWLKSTKRCNPIFVEKGTAVSCEMPDVIGWKTRASILIECKTSRSDFLADKKKAHRAGKGMGSLRFYLCEKNIIVPEDLPDGWGLLYAERIYCGTRCKQFAPATERADEDVDIRAELGFLRSRLMEVQRFGR